MIALKEKAEPFKVHPVNEKSYLTLKETLDDLGLRGQSQEIEKQYLKSVRFARIAEWEYKIIKAQVVEKFIKRVQRLSPWPILICLGIMALSGVGAYFLSQISAASIFFTIVKVLGCVILLLCGVFCPGLLLAHAREVFGDKELVISPIETYTNMIPAHAIENLRIAKRRNIFDSFSIMWVKEQKDPLLVSQIKESQDYFYIDQWGEDISAEDLIRDKSAQVPKSRKTKNGRYA